MIPKHLPEDRFQVTVLHTQYAGHATLLAEQAAAAGAHTVVAVGGDGTVNEVARALTRHTDTALGIVPMGSGNGLARHIAVPMARGAALDLIARGETKLLDYGLINGQPFFCTCGVGFDAFVSERFAHGDRRGLVSYVENALTESLRYRAQTYEVVIDGSESHTYRAYLIACGNAGQYGNNVYIAPKASMSDGLLDVTVMQQFPLAEAPLVVAQMLSKRLDQNSHIRTFKCRQLRIRRAEGGPVHCDGDPVESGQVLDISVVPRGVRMVVNPGASKGFAWPSTIAFADLFSDFIAR